MDGVNYFHVKVVGLLFVATTRVNVSPSLILELLQRVARVIKDYLGVLSEDSLRKNFVLVYELLDEVIVSSFYTRFLVVYSFYLKGLLLLTNSQGIIASWLSCRSQYEFIIDCILEFICALEDLTFLSNEIC